MRRAGGLKWRSVLAAAGLLVWLGGCSGSELPQDEEFDDSIIPQVDMPPADGPTLVATVHRAVVRDRPSVSGKVLGTLALGAHVARGPEPYTKHACAGGWYNIRPQGWVCAGDGVSIDTNVSASVVAQAHLAKPLPYRYGRVSRGAAVAYGTVPSREQQRAAEPKMGSLTSPATKRLGLAANDVPLDEAYLPTGLPVLLPEADGVGEDGYRTSDTWWQFPGAQSAPAALATGASLLPASTATQTRVLKRKSGVALTTSFVVDAGAGKAARRFGLMPDGRVVPTDRLVAAEGTAWHGVDLSKSGLPVAFALRRGIRAYQLGNNATVRRLDEEFEPREPIALSGRFRTVNRERYYYARDDFWVRHRDLIMIAKRHKFPDWATPEQKWLDVSLANQTLVAWEGHKPVYATLISSGTDRLGDPQTGPSTVQGVFRLRSKHVSRNVDDREVGQAYSVSEAPWAMEFHEGFSLIGCYWHSRFGEARSYHDVALAPVDAHFLWHWSAPHVPEHWHSVAIAEGTADNTIVYVHK